MKQKINFAILSALDVLKMLADKGKCIGYSAHSKSLINQSDIVYNISKPKISRKISKNEKKVFLYIISSLVLIALSALIITFDNSIALLTISLLFVSFGSQIIFKLFFEDDKNRKR